MSIEVEIEAPKTESRLTEAIEFAFLTAIAIAELVIVIGIGALAFFLFALRRLWRLMWS